MEDRDPLFIACFHASHEGYKDDVQFTLIDNNGELLLRSGEQLISRFIGDIMMLRYPEQKWLVNNETIHDWVIYFTSERIVAAKKVLFQGAFEFFDHIENNGKFMGLHPTDEIKIDTFFHWLGQKEKRLKACTLTFQLANTRINMISCIKLASPELAGVECWYDDAPNASQTLIQFYPKDMEQKAIFQLGVNLQGASTKEKLRCLEKKHILDPGWEPNEYNTYLAATQRLVNAPDFLAMGSGSLESESFEPITFQPHSIVWDTDVFLRSITGKENIRIVNLKY